MHISANFVARFSFHCGESCINFRRNPEVCVKRSLVVLILGGSLLSAAHAETGQWRSIGPEGGTVNALSLNPQSPATLYATVNSQRAFKTTDGGASWIETGPSNKQFIFDPHDPHILYEIDATDGPS